MKTLYQSLTLCFFLSSPALGNLVQNGSFESGTYSFGGDGCQALNAGSSVISNWTVFSPGGANISACENSNIYGPVTAYGMISIDLTGYTNSGPYAGVSQTIATVAGDDYTLSYALMLDQGAFAGGVSEGGPVGIHASAGSTTGDCANYNPPGTGNMSEICTLNFTASGSTTVISLQGLQGQAYIGLDNVDVELATASTPEPGTIMLVLAAIALLFLRLWRRWDFR